MPSLHVMPSLPQPPLNKGTMGSRWELRHLAGSPGGGGGVFRLCHTLIRVNTV